ncbi:hypothetical protein [Streptomyces sp. NPDC127098]|uniref:hypothetical protein n=1 Tax=Streptomyces sp. NPDC127098 TaxID=3347137 RepID=UPI0036473A3C
MAGLAGTAGSAAADADVDFSGDVNLNVLPCTSNLNVIAIPIEVLSSEPVGTCSNG